jgi:small redox-active disulfide protein 2
MHLDIYLYKKESDGIIMEIKVLGTGCANCKKLLENTKNAVGILKIDADVLYVTDYVEIVKAGLMRTPGLIVNNKIISSGRVPTTDEIVTLLEKI